MEKANIIVLYGAVAVGKLTVGKILSEKLGYKLSHNHLINDLVWSAFKRETIEANRIIEKFRYLFYEEVAKEKVDLIITHTYAHDFVSMSGLSDPTYMKELEAIFEKQGGVIYFVHLKADNETLIKRTGDVSRKEFRKLTDENVAKELLEVKDFYTSAPVKNNLVIDNSTLTPEETAEKIISELKLK